MTLSDNRQQATTTDNRTTSEADNKSSLGGLSVSGERPVAGVSIKIKYLGGFFCCFSRFSDNAVPLVPGNCCVVYGSSTVYKVHPSAL